MWEDLGRDGGWLCSDLTTTDRIYMKTYTNLGPQDRQSTCPCHGTNPPDSGQMMGWAKPHNCPRVWDGTHGERRAAGCLQVPRTQPDR